jgi:hypothetical protein
MNEEENREIMLILMEAAGVIANPAPTPHHQASDLAQRLIKCSRRMWQASLAKAAPEPS